MNGLDRLISTTLAQFSSGLGRLNLSYEDNHEAYADLIRTFKDTKAGMKDKKPTTNIDQ